MLGIADIADSLGMSRSTTHRYVITLVALGYLEQGASRKYRLGLRVTDLGMSALDSTGLREHSHPELEELRQRTSHTAGLGVLDGEEILYVDRVRGFRRERSKAELDPRPGSRLPAHCTAIGKLLLAYLPEHEQRELIAKLTLTKHGPNTITAKKALRDELERIRREGLAVNDQELAPELRALAAPVRDQTGAVRAAVNLSVPSAIAPARGARRRARPTARRDRRAHLREPRLPRRRRVGPRSNSLPGRDLGPRSSAPCCCSARRCSRSAPAPARAPRA